jgi:radical SAM protein with 4Fe4S-binding SPASM domain
MKARKNELSPVLNRKLFEIAPPNINKKDWLNFRNKYNAATNLEFNEMPIQLDVELNSICNLKCPFCIQGVRDMGNNYLGYDCYKKIINEAIIFGAKSLKLNYQNEPLIVKDLEKYIVYAKNKGILNVYMSTNGILLSKKRSQTLIDSGITKIFISIDACSKEIFLKQRESNMYEKIVKNILGFIELRNSLNLQYPLIRVNFLKTQINKHEEEKFIKLWQNKADMIIIQEMNELIDIESEYFIKKDKKNYRCSFPFKQLVINATGDILPCCCMNGIDLKLGNINNMTLKEAWNCNKMKELKNLHKFGDYKTNPICKRCIDGK